LKASFVNRLRRCCKIFCQVFWEIRLKRSFENLSREISGIFNGAEFIIFYRFDEA
jgi:hypothetical protein